MTTYQIISSAGIDLGTYEAADADAALDAMARDAGYRDAEHAAEVAGPFEGRVTEIPSVTDDQIRDLSTEAGIADDQMQRLICSIALGEDVDSTTIFARSGLDEEQRQRLLSMSVDDARRECARVIADARAQS